MSQNPRADILRDYQQLFREMAIETRIVPPGPQTPLETLLARFANIGDLPFVDLQFSFYPNLLQIPEADNPLILQTFVELHDQADDDTFDALGRLIGQINYFMPLGAFGLLTEPGVIFLKCTSLVDTRLAPQLRRELFDKQVGMNLHSLNLFVPLLEGLYTGDLTLQGAITAVQAVASGQ